MEDNHYASELGKSLRRNIGDFFQRIKSKRSGSLHVDKASQLKESFLGLLAPAGDKTGESNLRSCKHDSPRMKQDLVSRAEETK